MPDWLEFRKEREELLHSAKGTRWKHHKYTTIKDVNGKKRYIYGGSSEHTNHSSSEKQRMNPHKNSVEKRHTYQKEDARNIVEKGMDFLSSLWDKIKYEEVVITDTTTVNMDKVVDEKQRIVKRSRW